MQSAFDLQRRSLASEAKEFVDAAQYRPQLFLIAALMTLDMYMGGWKIESIAPRISISGLYNDRITKVEGCEKVRQADVIVLIQSVG